MIPDLAIQSYSSTNFLFSVRVFVDLQYLDATCIILSFAPLVLAFPRLLHY